MSYFQSCIRLTIDGIVITTRGNFRPKADVMKPKNTLPIRPPNGQSEAIHVASTMVILPDGNGLSSDVNRIIDGEHQPVSSNGEHIA